MKIEIRDNLDDWQELYIDGKLALSGHSISTEDLLELIKENLRADIGHTGCDFDFEIIEWDFQEGQPLYE